MTAHPERKPDALDLAEKIDGFASELKDAAMDLYSMHRRGIPVPARSAPIDYARDVAHHLLAALDAYEART